jgi:serine/threonine protein phosphatase PrpC
MQGRTLRFECAELSLIGNREENQDRVAIAQSDAAALLVAVDGMGGHSDGARAAGLAIETIASAFRQVSAPLFDPQGFLHLVIGRAHTRLAKLGADLRVELRPRATCALCLVQDGFAYWAHVGDSRIYHLRGEEILDRTRDHSHVEVLLQEGLIREDEMSDHPMRNFVECCIGGNIALPGMTVAPARRMRPGDVVLVCTDGFWSGLSDAELARLGAGNAPLAASLQLAGEKATRTTRPYSDNTSAAALRWLG